MSVRVALVKFLLLHGALIKPQVVVGVSIPNVLSSGSTNIGRNLDIQFNDRSPDNNDTTIAAVVNIYYDKKNYKEPEDEKIPINIKFTINNMKKDSNKTTDTNGTYTKNTNKVLVDSENDAKMQIDDTEHTTNKEPCNKTSIDTNDNTFPKGKKNDTLRTKEILNSVSFMAQKIPNDFSLVSHANPDVGILTTKDIPNHVINVVKNIPEITIGSKDITYEVINMVENTPDITIQSKDIPNEVINFMKNIPIGDKIRAKDIPFKVTHREKYIEANTIDDVTAKTKNIPDDLTHVVNITPINDSDISIRAKNITSDSKVTNIGRVANYTGNMMFRKMNALNQWISIQRSNNGSDGTRTELTVEDVERINYVLACILCACIGCFLCNLCLCCLQMFILDCD